MVEIVRRAAMLGSLSLRSLTPVEPRDRNHMMDGNKVMSVCFDAFCFRLVGHLRTSKYVSPLRL